jgi:predicted AAA+ superfamily ATPase
MKKEPVLIKRYLEKDLGNLVRNQYSCLLLGPRQTGKTTLTEKVLALVKNKKKYYLQDPGLRILLEQDPGKIIRDIEVIDGSPYVFIDEAQKVPELFDAAQLLIDKKKAQFIFSGSSARKLRRSGVNLLPGRIKRFYLDPLLWGELGFLQKGVIRELALNNINTDVNYSLEEMLVYGQLPGIAFKPVVDRKEFLEAYSQIYLEEEIRAEALSRKIGAFSKFLELAALESGTSPNLSKLSNESGVSVPTIKEFYSLLEDTLVVEKVEPYLKSARKRIMASSRYYFFDIGVRNAIAKLPLEKGLVNAQKGTLFEHFVILEIIRRVRLLRKNYSVNYWRTAAGAEVDCVIDMGDRVIPIEIKSSIKVSEGDLSGLKIFLSSYPKVAKEGYIITMGGNNEKITDNITAIPWFNL